MARARGRDFETLTGTRSQIDDQLEQLKGCSLADLREPELLSSIIYPGELGIEEMLQIEALEDAEDDQDYFLGFPE